MPWAQTRPSRRSAEGAAAGDSWDPGCAGGGDLEEAAADVVDCLEPGQWA